MAETIKKFLDLEGTNTLVAKLKEEDVKVLSDAKAYSDSKDDQFDAAGTATSKVKELADGQVKTNTDAIAKLNGVDTVEGSVANQIKVAKDVLQGEIGTLEDLSTTAKSDLVSAVNEVRAAIQAGGTNATLRVDTSATTEGSAKTYAFYQGDTLITRVEVPKDMVVSSGTVEKNPEGQAEGTYLVLTLANATNDKVYINVGTLVDIYTAKKEATQVQLVIDSVTREISATIVAGSITDVELAENAVTTAKIADGNVTKAKLSKEVQDTLDAVVSGSLTSADITTGVTNGTIAVKGNDVPVNGLGSAAYKSEEDFEVAGEAAKVQTSLDAYKTSNDTAVSTNTSDISELKTKVSALEDISYEAISVADINALFA